MMALISKVKNYIKGHNPDKAHLHPLRDVCVQYNNKSANGFRDNVPRTRHGDDNILGAAILTAPLSLNIVERYWRYRSHYISIIIIIIIMGGVKITKVMKQYGIFWNKLIE